MVDTKAPTVDVVSPSEGSYITSGTVNLTWSGTDATSGIAYYEVKIDDGQWNITTMTSKEFTGIEDGPHTAYVRAFDNAGNENSTSVSFLIDTVAPTISITSPANGSYINTQSAELMWSGYDGGSGIAYYLVYLNGDQVANTTECHCELTGLLDGTYTAQVKAFDMAGNENDTKVGFTMSTGPVVSIDSPVTISTPTTMWAVYYTNESSLTMTGSVTDIAPLSSANITLYLNGIQVYRGKITDLSTLYDLDQRYTLFVGNDTFVMMNQRFRGELGGRQTDLDI